MAATDPAPAGRDDPVLGSLIAVSSLLTEPVALEPILVAVCEGIRAAAGFESVWVELPEPAGGLFRVRAAAGPGPGADPPEHSRDQLTTLLESGQPLDGCVLLPPRLAAPLRSRREELAGVIWAEGASDPPDRSRAVRVFANLAAAALDSASHHDQLRFLTEHDPLTRLLNRRAFSQRLEIEAARSIRYAHPLALVLCDLDGFRALNEARGHGAGDETLEQVGRALTGALRRADAAARVGGDEFALILPETTDREAGAVIERVAAAIGRIPGAAGPLSASFGTAMSPHDGSQPQELHTAAESALGAARRAGAEPPEAGA